MSGQAATQQGNADVLVRVRGLKKYFASEGSTLFHKQYIKAVDNVSFDIYRRETLGLVGESGCGKSTLGRTLINLYAPTAGEVSIDGQEMSGLKGKKLAQARQKAQYIFQDPSASLNPRRTIRDILMEPYRIHRVGTEKEREDRLRFLMDRVGLEQFYLTRYPHEMSGGQRQRVGIARALALFPKFIICDEAVSALDVSIQAQVINLLEELQDEFDLTYLFISHDLSVIHHISDRVAVMYLGQMVELGTHREIYDNPLHPYSKALISAIPKTDSQQESKRILLTGDVPSPVSPPSGCRFHTRCSYCMDVCKKEAPAFREVEPGHCVACHLMK